MMLRASFLLIAATLATVASFSISGCGGASLNTGEYRNLEEVKPDFVNPPWFEQFAEDPTSVEKKYKNRVLQLDVIILDFEELASGITIKGYTGDSERYRILCIFPSAASATLQDTKADDRITVKGLFAHVEDAQDSYQIVLKNCVLAR